MNSRTLSIHEDSPLELRLPRFADSKALLVSVIENCFKISVVVALALASYFLISHFIFQSVEVVGVSMFPTLHNADHYFLKRWVFLVREPERRDIVVIKDPTDGSYAVKRIVALSGESVYLKNGQVFVNGRKLSEPYLRPGTPTYITEKKQEELITCGKDCYFVMGDNRNNSFDSRYYGPVPRQNILGLISD